MYQPYADFMNMEIFKSKIKRDKMCSEYAENFRIVDFKIKLIFSLLTEKCIQFNPGFRPIRVRSLIALKKRRSSIDLDNHNLIVSSSK